MDQSVGWCFLRVKKWNQIGAFCHLSEKAKKLKKHASTMKRRGKMMKAFGGVPSFLKNGTLSAQDQSQQSKTKITLSRLSEKHDSQEKIKTTRFPFAKKKAHPLQLSFLVLKNGVPPGAPDG